MSPASVYNHRHRWPEFARRWDQAIEEGYDRLATALMGSAGAMLGDPDFLPDPALGPVSVDDAIRLLGLHKRRAIGWGRKPGRVRREPTIEEVRSTILAKVKIAKRARDTE